MQILRSRRGLIWHTVPGKDYMRPILLICWMCVVMSLPLYAGTKDIGTGSSEVHGLSRPWAGTYSVARRYQILVLTSEMPSACNVTGIGFFVEDPSKNHGVFSNAQMLVCATALTNLTSNFATNYSGNTPRMVWSNETADLQWVDGAWNSLPLQSEYAHDGSSNFVVEIRYDGNDSNSIPVHGWQRPYATYELRTVDGALSDAVTGVTWDHMISMQITFKAYDGDYDGLADAWEVAHFGNSSVYVGADDPDGDGEDNYGEYLAGTDPMDRDERLLNSQPSFVGSNGVFEFSWTSSTGRIYSVLTSTDLVDWVSVPSASNMTGTGVAMTHTNSYTGGVQKFYTTSVGLE